jgi:hypothetical protein
MRAHRTVALLLAAGAMMVVGAGAALVSPGVAAAAPGYGNGHGGGAAAGGAYPAPKPVLMVNAHSVTTGGTVRVRGAGFAKGEPVVVTIRYRITLGSAAFHPPFGGGGYDRANRQGKVMGRVSLRYPGYATITIKGLKSHKRASVTVRVLAWRGQWGGFFRMGGMTGDSFLGGLSTSVGVPAMQLKADTRDTTSSDNSAQLVAGLFGVVGLMGSAAVAFRRRRA